MPTYNGGIPATPSARDALARSNGFPSYDAMILFQKNREVQTNTPTPVAMSPQAQAIHNWGPIGVFKYLTDVLGKFNSGG